MIAFSMWEIFSWVINLAKVGYQNNKSTAERRSGDCRWNEGLNFNHLIKTGSTDLLLRAINVSPPFFYPLNGIDHDSNSFLSCFSFFSLKWTEVMSWVQKMQGNNVFSSSFTYKYFGKPLDAWTLDFLGHCRKNCCLSYLYNIWQLLKLLNIVGMQNGLSFLQVLKLLNIVEMQNGLSLLQVWRK